MRRPRGVGGAPILVSTRQGPALKDKTLLACEMTSEAGIEARERIAMPRQATPCRPAGCVRRPARANAPLSLQ
ncbi:hypothetical protein A8F20_15865 [Burkholderia cenocepacia]|nr:hypothetical protein A8F20_15865 [Burkholderia cenocepacia]